MSASRRTDTRSFFTGLFQRIAMLIAILPMLISEASLAASFQTRTQIGLFEGLPLEKILEHIHSASQRGEIIFNSHLGQSPLTGAAFDLIQYMNQNVDSQTPDEILATIPKYKRMEMFGTWVNENAPVDCYNTRAEVLIRDAVPGTTLSHPATNPCLISRGEWVDPYSGNSYLMASAVQIDHVVPLKNAYRSGAHTWTHGRRCTYANFLIDPKHLLAVSGHENMAKGDDGPEDYMPPRDEYACTYLTNWMRIKATWNLSFSQDESAAIQRLLRSHECPVADTQVTLVDFESIRAKTLQTNVKCSEGPNESDDTSPASSTGTGTLN